MTMLELAGVQTYYGRAHILAGIDLSVARGEVVALLGRNGAGKTTTMRTVMGLVRPAAGDIRFNGRSIAGAAPYRISRAGIGYVPEDRRIFTELTVAENLEVGRQPPHEGRPRWTPERIFELFPVLGAMRRRRGGQMSGGEQQMLTIARTLMGNPALLLLDEPSEGLAPLVVQQMARTVKDLKAEGLTIVLSEQNLSFCAAVCDRAYIIEKGAIRYEGTMAALNADEETRRQYLSV